MALVFEDDAVIVLSEVFRCHGLPRRLRKPPLEVVSAEVTDESSTVQIFIRIDILVLINCTGKRRR